MVTITTTSLQIAVTAPDDSDIVVTEQGQNIAVDATTDPIAVSVEQVGRQGVQGDSAYQVWLDQGNVGTQQDFLDSLKGGNILLVTAGEVLGGGRVVKIETDGKAYLYDTSDEANYGKSIGITKAAALLGASLEVYVNGEAYEAGSGWTAGDLYYAGASGVPTTSVPTTGIIKLIGVGSRADAILMTNIFEII